jgi:hypothetical protein
MAGQSSLLTSGNSGDSDDGAHIAASLHLRRERYGSKLNYELS